jgi:DNA mismatch repair protein MutS2
MVRDYEERIASLSKELRTLKKEALEEARRIIDEANATIERSVKEIRETGADRETVKSIRQDVEGLKDRLATEHKALRVESSTSDDSEKLVVGSIVQLRNGTDSGEILHLSSDESSAEVLFGTIRMRVPVIDLRASDRQPTRVKSGPHFTAPERSSVERDLDLRGMTGDEALPLIDKFIDNACLAGLHRIDIIHGKGTGALRKKVTSYLERHPRVKTFRLADWNEGGTGATVVELEEAQ